MPVILPTPTRLTGLVQGCTDNDEVLPRSHPREDGRIDLLRIPIAPTSHFPRPTKSRRHHSPRCRPTMACSSLDPLQRGQSTSIFVSLRPSWTPVAVIFLAFASIPTIHHHYCCYCDPLSGKLEYLPGCLLYTSPSPRDLSTSRMPSSA